MIKRALGVALVLAFVAVPARAAVIEQDSGHPFTDTFDGAVDAHPTYGLNDNLKQRQGVGAVTYDRVSGKWHTGTPPKAWYAQVNHPRYPGTLSMHLGTTAVRLDAPSTGESVAATLTPVAGNRTSGDWSSIVLSRSANSWGYVSNSDVDLGFLVRANGGVQVFQAGKLVGTFAVRPAANYRVSLQLGSTVDVTVNGERHRVDVAVPTERQWVYLGRYSDDDKTVSLVDDLRISAMDSTVLRKRSPGLKYFGYWGARVTAQSGNHVPEVRGHSNLNLVLVSDRDAYRPQELDKCAPGTCLVVTGNEFFDCTNSCALYPNFEERWQRLVAALKGHEDRVAGFYLLDEAFHRGASLADVTRSAQAIKKSFPDKKVMLVEPGSKIDSLVVPAEVDWVGFDEYGADETRADEVMTKLEERAPGKELFVVGEGTAVLPSQTDEAVARQLYMYSQLMDLHPQFSGMLVFGPWTGYEKGAQVPAGQPTLAGYPKAADAAERVAAFVLGDARVNG